MPIPSRKYALAGLALALFAPASLGAQDVTRVTPVADDVLVRQSAFTLWWPEYDRLMREFLRNTPADAGRIALPAPEPEEFFREIAIIGRIPHPALPDVALYSVTTEGDLFQALFVVSSADRAWPLVNRADPAAFRQDMPNAYVAATNALLERHGRGLADAQAALTLARFTVEAFYNFDYRYVPSSVDSITFAELNRVRVLESIDDIPQGLRRFDVEKGNALLYGKIPESAEALVTPPRVRAAAPGDFEIRFYSWHPRTGELKRWEIHLVDGQFASLKDETVERWVSFTVESF